MSEGDTFLVLNSYVKPWLPWESPASGRVFLWLRHRPFVAFTLTAINGEGDKLACRRFWNRVE